MLVIGERAVRPFIGGDGSSRVKNPPVVREPLAELKRCLGKGAEVEFLDEGCLKTYENEIGYMENALYEKASKADAVVVFLGQDIRKAAKPWTAIIWKSNRTRSTYSGCAEERASASSRY